MGFFVYLIKLKKMKNDIPTLEIFNVKIFGDDALEFLSWSHELQKEWIKTMTNQQSDDVIYEFLNNPKISSSSLCLDCGRLNNKIVDHGGNISQTDATENADSSESNMVRESSTGDSVKRSKNIKKSKNK